MATGEHGSHMLLWDFPSMDRSFQSYRTIIPYEGQQIHALKYNPSSTHLLCATGDPRAKLFSSDGRLVSEFKRGDMYVMDMRKTQGHVAGLTAIDWDPRGNNKFASCGMDSTMRIWDCERPLGQEQVVVAKTKARGKIAVTACAYNVEGSMIASAQYDGGLSIWPSKGPFLRPAQHMAAAHQPSTETSAVAFVPGSSSLVTRGGDSTVKLWDPRKMTEPLAVATQLPAAGPEANLAFDPSGRWLLTGLEQPQPDSNASVAVLSTSTLCEHQRINLSLPGSVLSVSWHPELNQIAAGLSSGQIAVLYDLEKSQRGVRLGIAKRIKPQAAISSTSGPIITPNALPLFRQDQQMSSSKRRREKARQDPVRSHKPQVPLYGHGRGGAIGVNETQHIMKSLIKDTIRDEDPREALLKYAAKAESDPKFVTPSYKDAPVFDDSGMADEPEMKRRK
ncbi:hypothetical protein IWW36_005599 [Coemansia brasiliensis]|uniref:WD40 repeat-like protein n=1 Tax=Coemansia brasiliensis TaxID=2650707 RepID=A0A9W8LWX3_9FUNG|nr:hypothetical protein IWW36_005599 [Coemansia brasiliensis]